MQVEQQKEDSLFCSGPLLNGQLPSANLLISLIHGSSLKKVRVSNNMWPAYFIGLL